MTLLDFARQARGAYRQARAETRLWYWNTRFPAARDAPDRQELRSALRARLAGANPQIKTLLVLPINNWEAELERSFEAAGPVDTLELPAVPFFRSRREWASFFRDVNGNVLRFFEATYDPTKTNLVFCYVSDFHLSPETVEAFKRPNTVAINFNWDDLLWFHGRHRGQPVGVRKIAPHFDLNLSFSHRALAQYRGAGARAIFWDSEDELDSRIPVAPPTIHKALFVGSCYGRRRKLVATIRRAGLPIDVFGAGWGTRFLSAEELPHCFASYAVTVGLNTVGDAYSLSGIKGRDFEVPLNGGLYLTNDHPELRHCYVPGKEILTYRTFGECVQTVREILDDPAAFAAVREAGQRKARARHRWSSRIRFLLKLIDDTRSAGQ
jgi:spore maturation protein CgeB